MKSKFFLLVSICFLLISINANSQKSDSLFKSKFLIEGGIEYGGDEIVKVIFTTGDDQSMKAGQGGFLAVGGEFQTSKLKNFMMRASIGIKYNTTAAENANIRLTRFPISLMPYLKVKDDYRIGVGISTHLNPLLKGDGFIPDVDFSSNLGPRIEFGYKWVALTYTAINYKDSNNKSFSASSIGLSVSFTIPK